MDLADLKRGKIKKGMKKWIVSASNAFVGRGKLGTGIRTYGCQ